MNKPKRVAVIGFDCAIPKLIEKHMAEGYLPNFKKLIQGGVFAQDCLSPLPTITPPNWATIATGANLGTHQITDFHVHKEGGPHTSLNAAEAFNSDRVKAQYVWDAADKAGKKCVILNYPGSWPSHMKNGIVVGGEGLTVGEHRDGHLLLESKVSLCANQIISTDIYPRGIRGSFQQGEDWKNLDKPGEDPLELVAEMNFLEGQEELAPATWYVLARQSGEDGYDTITLSPRRDMKEAFCTIKLGQWSPKIISRFKMKEGTEKEGFFRCKLTALSDDTTDFTLFLTSIIATSGWSSPAEVAAKIESPDGVPIYGGGLAEYSIGSIDLDTYIEVNEIHDLWLGDAAVSLLKDQDWDLFYMHSHPPDWAYHVILNDMDPNTQTDEEKGAKAWEAHLHMYQSQDRMLGRIVEAAGKDTLFVLVSDHGAVADGPMFNPNEPLIQASLQVPFADEDELMKQLGFSKDVPFVQKYLKLLGAVDMNKSKATVQGQCYIYVNLKGRDPQGIVEPEDYQKVQLQIIDALYAWIDPRTKTRPVSLALTKEDARILGLYGEKVGDVVFAVYPWFSSQHGPILPTGEWGVGSLKSLCVFCGPGIKKGLRLKRTMWLQDIVPTICYLADLPLPADVDGAVLWQVLKDPDIIQKEITKLKDGLARMEKALQIKERPIWDHKHG
jgi:predicted AlkP superfamily phosphohydrolase/phosphomutase